MKERDLSRRDFLKLCSSLGLAFGLSDKRLQFLLSFAERTGENLDIEKILSKVPPRHDMSLHNLGYIPESVLSRIPKIESASQRRYSIPLHMAKLRDLMLQGKQIKQASSTDPYFANLQKVISAGKRGNNVTFVMEMPVDFNSDFSLWDYYCYWLIPQIQATRIVIGNEMADKQLVKQLSKDGIEEGGDYRMYAELFGRAHDIIRKVSPKTSVILSAPHYYGQGKLLLDQLFAVAHYNAVDRPKTNRPPVILDGVALHFYDKASKLPEFIKQNRRVIDGLGVFGKLPIYLTEHGVHENARLLGQNFTQDMQARIIFQQAVVVAALLEQGLLREAFCYTAFEETGGIHALFIEDYNKEIRPTAGFYGYEMGRRLASSRPSLGQDGDVTKVDSLSPMGPCTILWNDGKLPKRIRLEGAQNYIFDGTSLKKVDGKEIFLPASQVVKAGEGLFDIAGPSLISFSLPPRPPRKLYSVSER